MSRNEKFSRIGRVAVAVVILAMCGGMARAQSDAPAGPPPPPGRHGGFGPGPMSDDAMGFVGFEAGLGKTVTGAPFSANVSTQSTQVLADGNQIQHTTTGTIARDSQGRTRRDVTLPAIGPWSTSGQTDPPHAIVINDNVASVQYVLQPERKIAREIRRPKLGKQGRGGPSAQFAPPNGGPGPGPGPGPGRNNQNTTTTSLGTQTINGVTAEGTRVMRTIPAGAIGNANPIVMTTESWYSPDLQTMVMIKRSDPRMGETTFQLTNIQKQEPDAALFQVPSDYTVKQGGPDGKGRFGRKSGQQAPPLPPPN